MKSVWAGGEDRDRLLATFNHEVNVSTDRATNPVALHGEHLGRPLTLEGVEVIEKTICVIGDAEVPLGELLLHHDGARALRGAIRHNLLVGQNGLVYRVPVDPAVLAIGQALVIHLQEQPLVPLVVLRV